MTHRRFADRHARGHRRPVVRGTAFSFSLSEAARVTIAIVAESSGRLSHGRCVGATRTPGPRSAPVRAWSGRGRSFRYRRQGAREAGVQRPDRHAHAGAGRYRAALTAVDTAGNRSTPHTIAFTRSSRVDFGQRPRSPKSVVYVAAALAPLTSTGAPRAAPMPMSRSAGRGCSPDGRLECIHIETIDLGEASGPAP